MTGWNTREADTVIHDLVAVFPGDHNSGDFINMVLLRQCSVVFNIKLVKGEFIRYFYYFLQELECVFAVVAVGLFAEKQHLNRLIELGEKFADLIYNLFIK